METKDRGVLAIETDNSNRKKITFSPVNGTVWLTKCGLTELFGVYQQTVNACIDAIFKANTIHAEEYCKCNLIAGTGKNGIRYEPYEFNLMFVFAMAFRIDSENAKLLREWIMNQILVSKTVSLKIPITDFQKFEWN